MSPSQLSPEAREILLKLPAQLPPPGVTVDFQHPDNIRTLCNGLLFFYIGISTVLVAVRIYTQSRVIRKLRIEDYILVLAWVSKA